MIKFIQKVTTKFRRSELFKFYRKTPVLESLLNEFAGLQAATQTSNIGVFL